MNAARVDPEILARIPDWVSNGALALADLGYEANPQPSLSRSRNRKTVNSPSTSRPTTRSAAPCAAGERANSLLKTTYKALRRYRSCPWRLGDITAAALILLHHEHRRTT